MLAALPTKLPTKKYWALANRFACTKHLNMHKALPLLFWALLTAVARDGKAQTLVVDINEQQIFQTMEGFGASLTESSAWLLHNKLSPDQRAAALRDLFDARTGIGLSYVRLTMGASDFSLSDFTYADVPGDFVLDHFSIARDEASVIPVLKDILAISPGIRLMGSPWSAPAWMKDSGDLHKGRLRRDCYYAYARYFARFVEAYAAHGLRIDAVTLQNEPHNEPCGYPCLRMDASEQAQLTKITATQFQKSGIATGIILWDHNWDEPEYALEILKDSIAYAACRGVAFHCYSGQVGAQSKVAEAFPGKSIYFTECSGGQWAPVFSDNLLWDYSTLLIESVRNHAVTVLKWNLALDENHGPINGGCSDCRGVVTINTQTGAITKNEEYYALGHASRFVRPGAIRIGSTDTASGQMPNVAFKNTDGTYVVLAANQSDKGKTVELRQGGRKASFQAPPKSILTIQWKQLRRKDLHVWVTTGDKTLLMAEQ